jgi:hypothetical protein
MILTCSWRRPFDQRHQVSMTSEDQPPRGHDLCYRVEDAVEVLRGATGPELVAEREYVLAHRLTTLRTPALSGISIAGHSVRIRARP